MKYRSNKVSNVIYAFKASVQKEWLLMFCVLYIFPISNGYIDVDYKTYILLDAIFVVLLPLAVMIAYFRSNNNATHVLLNEYSTTYARIAISILIGGSTGIVGIVIFTKLFQLFSPSGSISYVPILIKEYGLKSILYLAVSAGLFEEFLFKFVLIRTSVFFFEARSTFVVASASLFAICHLEQGVVPALFYGVVFGATTAHIYHKYRKLSELTVVHFVVDFLFLGNTGNW